MNPIVIVLAILLLIGIVPKRHSEKAYEKATVKTEMQTIPGKETVKPENDDYPDNDCSIYWYVIDVNSL